MGNHTQLRSRRRAGLGIVLSLGLFGASCSDGVEEGARPWRQEKTTTADRLSGPVVLSPNVIQGVIRFDNSDPAVLAILHSEGISQLDLQAQSPSGYSASANGLTPVNELGGPYQLSAEASGGVGSVTYSVSASVAVNGGARNGTSGLGNGIYKFQPRTTTLEPTTVQPDGVTLDFTETVGVVRIRFGTDSTCAVPVPIHHAVVKTDQGLNYLNASGQPGYALGYYLMPGGMSLAATVDTFVGTNETWDTIAFSTQVQFHAGPDAFQDVCIPIPSGDSGSLGAIATPFQVFGHTLLPQTSYIRAEYGPQGNTRITYNSQGTVPEDQPSTWLRLPNMVPGDYSLLGEGLLDQGDTQVAFISRSGAPSSNKTTVIAGQTVDAKQSFANGEHYPFVSHPAHFRGNVLLYDRYAEDHPAALSSLSSLAFHTQWPDPTKPGGTHAGPAGGTSLLTTSLDNRENARTSFSGRFQAAQGRLDSPYSLPAVAAYDQPRDWVVPRLDLHFVSESQTLREGELLETHHNYDFMYYNAHPDLAHPETYRQGWLTLTQEGPAVPLTPGTDATQDHHYCFNEVQLRYTSSQGTFVNPVANVTGAFSGTDFEGNTVHYTARGTSYGTPAVGYRQPQTVFLAGRTTEGRVAFTLPQGTWHVSPGADFVNADGTISSGNFTGLDLTVGCGQRLEPVPGLAVSIQVEATCPSGNAAAVTGSVASADAPIDHLWYTLDEQLFELCTSDCPKDFSFNVPPAYAGATLTVYASSPLVQGVASASDSVPECASPEPDCIQVSLNDYNLFLLGDYSGGHDVLGRVAAGGDISMTDFSVGTGLPDGDIANTLVAGHALHLARGGVWGDVRYGSGFNADNSVLVHRGDVAQGAPIDFAARGAQLRALSSRLASLPSQGTTTLESWGGLMLEGSDPHLNVFQVNASAFTGAVLLSLHAPAGSLAVINVTGASATFSSFGHVFSGGIDQHGVLFNFVDASTLQAQSYGFWGTVLAPYAHVTFNDGSFDGGLYALSMTGNAEGHINPLEEWEICPSAARR
jgi:choice-of-anchor A domain-containing protein